MIEERTSVDGKAHRTSNLGILSVVCDGSLFRNIYMEKKREREREMDVWDENLESYVDVDMQLKLGVM